MYPFDESKLTAYALGELPESERAEIEQFVAQNDDARRFVDDTREFAAELKREFSNTMNTNAAVGSEIPLAALASRRANAGKVLYFWRSLSIIAAALLVTTSIYVFTRGTAAPFAERQSGSGLAISDSTSVSKAEDANTLQGIGYNGTTWVRGRAAARPNANEISERPPGNMVKDKSLGTAFAKNPDLLDQSFVGVDTTWPQGDAQGQIRTAQTQGAIAADGTKPTGAYAPPGDHNESETRLFDTIGTGAGSGREGRGESGGVFGGRRVMKVSGGKSKVDRNSDLHFSGRTGIPTDSPTTPSGVGFFLDDTQESRDGSLGKFQNNEGPGTESYQSIYENKFQHPEHNPLSTFSIDVDTASYANVRRFLTVQNTLPPANAIRIEELINYFAYGDAQPTDGRPLAVRLEVAACPWSLQNKLVRVSMKGKEIAAEERRITNLVFLIDVSGSMSDQNKLPLLKEGLRLLVRQLTENDRVAIVTYAGTSGVALPSTNASQRDKIMSVIDSLEAGGSTNGEAGIQMAYEQATANFIQKGVNRVILMTDGDFNVGVTDSNQLNTMIADKAKSGVFLSVLGFGMGNLKDSTMERLADKGNGNYAYIDSLREARKVLVDQMNGTLVTIAKDVKIQVEFNPAKVSAYRLIGYEDRALTAADFNNDKKDAGELGAGHGVTALYEIVPVGVQGGEGTVQVDALKYQNPAPQRAAPKVQNDSIELLTAKIRYKMPDADTSVAFEVPLNDSNKSYTSASVDFKFSAAVASFGMLLRGSQYKGTANWDAVLELAEESKGADALGYRREFIDLVMKAKSLAGNASK